MIYKAILNTTFFPNTELFLPALDSLTRLCPFDFVYLDQKMAFLCFLSSVK